MTPRQCKAYIDRRVTPSLAEMGLTYSNAPFIKEISKRPNVSMKELSDVMMVDKALTTRTVVGLIEEGFVKNVGIGHKYSLVLTEKGEISAGQIHECLNEAWESMLGCLTDDEKETFVKLLGKVLQSVRGA